MLPVLLLALAPVPAVLPQEVPASSLLLRSIRSGGMRRWYRVHVPPSYDPAVPAPVLLAFHGGGGNARQFADQTGLEATADKYGFLLVFPEGTGALGGWPWFTLETWNAGNCCGWAVNHHVDDVLFTRDMLDAVEAEWNVDPGQVFATGHSNGAMMCYRLAVEAPDRIVAIAPNAGALGVDGVPPLPIPIIAFHGRLDCHVPFAGGSGCGISGVDYRSQEETLRPFVLRNGVRLPTGPAERRGKAERWEGLAPTTGADIFYWWLIDGGHSWPGHGSAIGDPVNRDIDINEELWLFFRNHRR